MTHRRSRTQTRPPRTDAARDWRRGLVARVPERVYGALEVQDGKDVALGRLAAHAVEGVGRGPAARAAREDDRLEGGGRGMRLGWRLRGRGAPGTLRGM